MILNGYFGNPSTWLLLLSAWLSLGALFALAFCLIARMGGGRE